MVLDSLRTAARGLRRQPAFVTVVVLSLALGIALNTTMYGMLDALLRPRIDVRDPGHLYWIRFYGDYKWRVDAPTRDGVLSSGTHTYESVTRVELAVFVQQIQHDGHLSEGVVQAVRGTTSTCSARGRSRAHVHRIRRNARRLGDRHR